MPLPFFCAVCDKPINPTLDKKYATIHEKCMNEYLESIDYTTNTDTTDSPKK